MDRLAARDAERSTSMNHLHRIDRFTHVKAADIFQGAEIPPFDDAIFACRNTDHARLTVVPDERFDRALGGSPVRRITREHLRIGIRSIQVKEADLFFLAALEQKTAKSEAVREPSDDRTHGSLSTDVAVSLQGSMPRCGRYADVGKCAALDRCMCPRSCCDAAHSHSVSQPFSRAFGGWTHAVKSALPVAARDVSAEILLDHTAPL